jgi:hypothetical protein
MFFPTEEALRLSLLREAGRGPMASLCLPEKRGRA